MCDENTGKYAIYFESAGGEPIPTTTFNVTFDNTEHEDDIFTFNGAALVELGVTGHYLIGHSLGVRRTVTGDRGVFEVTVRLAGTDLAYGRAGGYVRDAEGATEAFANGITIINNETANVNITLRATRTDTDASLQIERGPAPEAGGFWLLKLDDNADYIRLQRVTSDLSTSTTTYQDVDWNQQDELDTGSFAHSTSTDPEWITFQQTGHYLVCVNVHCEGDAVNDRTNAEMVMVRDNSGSPVEVIGTHVTGHIRNQSGANNRELCYYGIIQNDSAGEKYKFQYRHESATDGVFTPKAGKTALAAVKMNDNADYFRVHDAGGGQRCDTTSGAEISWDTTDEEDTGTFDHNPAAGTDADVEIQSRALILTLCTVFADRTNTGNRIVPRISPRIDDTIQNWGMHSSYNRGLGPAHPSGDAFRSGSSGGGIYVVDTSELFDWQVLNKATGTDADCVFQADELAWQGVNVGQWLPKCVQVDETVEIPESVLVLVGKLIQADETVNISEEILNFGGIMFVVDDGTMTLLDTQETVVGEDHGLLIINETVNILETIPRPMRAIRIQVDEVEQITEAVLAQPGILLIVSETLEIQEIIQAVETILSGLGQRLRIVQAGPEEGRIAGGGPARGRIGG